MVFLFLASGGSENLIIFGKINKKKQTNRNVFFNYKHDKITYSLLNLKGISGTINYKVRKIMELGEKFQLLVIRDLRHDNFHTSSHSN